MAKDTVNVSLPSIILSSFKVTTKHRGVVEFSVISDITASKSSGACAVPEMVLTLNIVKQDINSVSNLTITFLQLST